MKLRSKIFTAAAVSSTVLIGGAAYAYFTGGGTGTGSASIGSAPVVNLKATLSSPLYPGSSGVSMPVLAQNESDTGVVLGTVTLTPTVLDGATDVTETCAITVTTLTPTAEVPSHTSSIAGNAAGFVPIGTVLVSMENTASSQDVCKDKTVTFTIESGTPAT